MINVVASGLLGCAVKPALGYCPLKFAAGESIGYECEGADCAWFANGQCALRLLAMGPRVEPAELCRCVTVPGDNPCCGLHGGPRDLSMPSVITSG
jgi:hypothetical protein